MHGRDPSAAGEGSAGSKPGTPETYDYEYERNGVSNQFMLFAPLEGWRRVDVTKRRTKVDWAQQIQRLVDEDYPDKRIVLVMDNFFKHACSGFVLRGFEPAEVQRSTERLEIHYTPKHGSWLNMAEMEISAMVGQCLNRRPTDRETLRREVDVWQERRNREAVRVD